MTETDAVRIAATLEHLSRLVSFPSLPGQSNRDLLGYVTAALEQAGVESVCTFHGDGERGNLVAMIGPRCGGGVMLNGHTDVVPVDGQTWRSDPFTLRVEDGRAFARGAVDMKGFLACLLAMAPRFAAADLARPVIYAMTFDEEIGGEGAGLLAPPLEDHPLKPACCIVGEPTGLAIVGGCKGGIELRTEISGLSAHASDPRRGANAIYAAGRLIAEIEAIARRYASVQIHDSPFDPSYTTLNVGTIVGGSARNAVPDNCVVDWEIRPVSPEHGDAILEAIETLVAEEILPGLRDAFPEAEMRTRIEALVPPLSPPGPDDPALALARVLTGQEAVGSVSFGTDAGYFQQVGIPTIVCGPGTLETAHMPDEHIRIDELAAGLGMLERLAGHLAR